jgi:ABC-type multidrug transport system ATPase subunit
VRLELHGVGVRLDRRGRVISGVDLEAPAGHVVGLLGPSGSGKTTLLHAIAGLIPWGRPGQINGVISIDGAEVGELDPGQRAHLVATCLDRPEAQLFLPTPRAELEAATRMVEARPHLDDEIIETLALAPLLDRRNLELSSGERHRVALAAAASAHRPVLLLDEPTVHLDSAGIDGLVSLIRTAARRGATVLVTEQAGWRLGDAVDEWFELVAGGVHPVTLPEPPAFPVPAPPRAAVALATTALSLSRGSRKVLTDGALELRAGEIVLLTGANGAGKSTLARALAGHGGVPRNRLSWRGAAPPTIMLANAELQLFADTAAGELRLAGCDPMQVGEVLLRHRLATLAGRPPWTLSRGERQRLLHAALDATAAPVTILDEPAQGLDPAALRELGEVLCERAAAGRAFLIATHRPEFAALAHRRLTIGDGRLTETAEGV